MNSMYDFEGENLVVVPPGSKELGNTITNSHTPKKRINPAIRWCFTFNNYTEEEFCSICSICSVSCRYAIIGREISKSGTKHLQGYIEFKTKNRPISIFKNTKIHFEKCRGTKLENIKYCSKEDKNAWIYPVPYKIDLKKSDFYEWENILYNIVIKEPHQRLIYWFYDEQGCSGKTTFSKWLYMNLPSVAVLSGTAGDMKNGIIEYEQMQGQLPNTIIMNIPRTKKNYMSWTGIEEIKDMFFFSGKYHGGFVCGKPPHLICLANSLPDVSKVSLDRWAIYHILPGGGVDCVDVASILAEDEEEEAEH